MEKIHRLLTNILTDELEESKNFYTQLFDFKVVFDSDWFVQLVSSDENFELGIMQRTNELIPVDFQDQPQGFYITFVVENADKVFALAKKMGYEVVQEPKDTFYGQRRLLLKDPNGALVDVSSLISN